jgi:hypothetical protein
MKKPVKLDKTRRLRWQKVVIWSVAGLILAGGLTLAYVEFFYRPDIPLKVTSLSLEYGQQFKQDPKDLLQTSNQAILASAEIDTKPLKYKPDTKYPEAGNYQLAVSYVQKRQAQVKRLKLEVKDTKPLKYKPDTKYPEAGNYQLAVSYVQKRQAQVKRLKLEVKDTTPPELKIDNEPIALVASEQKPDYAKLFDAKDLSEYEISVEDSAINYQQAGVYEIKVTATDKYDNATTKTPS